MSFPSEYDIRAEIQRVREFLKVYFRNPIHGMATLPDWPWPTLILLQMAVASFCGALSGLIAGRLSLLIPRLIVLPFTATIGLLIWSGFLYYTLLFFFHVETQFKKLFSISLFAGLPFFAVYILSGIIPPVNLIGFLAMALLLIVGLCDHFRLERKRAVKLVGGLYLVYVLFWIFNTISWPSDRDRNRGVATPESYDILKQEFERKTESEESEEDEPGGGSGSGTGSGTGSGSGGAGLSGGSESGGGSESSGSGTSGSDSDSPEISIPDESDGY